MNTPTPTPRTDAATYPADCLGKTLVTNRDCSRALETELVTLTGACTCTHHNDQQRAACPVCLVATLTAERDHLHAQLRALTLICGTNDANKFETWIDRANARAERAEVAETVALAKWNGALERAMKAEADLAAALALGQQNCDDAYDELRGDCDELRADVVRLTAERDQLRAEAERFQRLQRFIDTAAAEMKAGFVTFGGIAELRAECDQLRAEVERLKKQAVFDSDHVHALNSAFATRAEVERLRSDRDCEKRIRKDAEEFRENAIARAYRAEADLATERARLDWLLLDNLTRLDNSISHRTAIDAAMKEDAK